jgi:molecular chaperone DnaK (HSP70)
MTAQFVVGIDLGTTNSVLAYSPLDDESPEVFVLPVPQLVAPQTVESRDMLPSFLYVPKAEERASGALQMPGAADAGASAASVGVVGQFARAISAELPERTISAAKSWLCHSRVDRRAAILPWQAPADVTKLSPVAVSEQYLRHLVQAWDAMYPDARLDQQRVVLTVPASFDASARELTLEAARAAGLPESLVLLEEPQAATYAWLADVGDRWRKVLKVGDRLLVCDIGGGTTDLTLVEVTESNGELGLHRVAVGNHLLVGGDNMDLALAHHVAGLFAEQGVELDPWQSVSLWHSCRAAKESLLSDGGREEYTISVPGRGSRLIGGLVSVSVNRSATASLLLDGFLPLVPRDAKPARPRASGFRELGLPFEADTAITKHLAAFLQQAPDDRPVTHVLFNGGVFKAAALRQRLLDQLKQWFPESAPRPVQATEDLDFAVARGACAYGALQARGGVRIRGGTARSYYVGIETSGLAIPGAGRPLKALCVVPQGMEEGTHVDVPGEPIGLAVGQAERFRFFSSATRRQDRPGDLLARWNGDELSETDSLEATLPAVEGVDIEAVPVRFESRVTELGVLELWCVQEPLEGASRSAEPQRWKLEFSVRDDVE